MVNLIKSFFAIPLSESDKTEFTVSINRVNIARAKVTTITFVVLEVMMLVIHCRTYRGNLFDAPYIYYGSMYVLMLVSMAAFFIIFNKLGADVPKHVSAISRAGAVFISFILAWCGGISLLDQLSGGEVIVYVVAVIMVAITPLFRPIVLFFVYSAVHSAFLLAMHHANLSRENAINATTVVIMAWAIAYMRYKKQAEDFNNKKLILQKNEELRLINMQLQEANRKLEIMSTIDCLTGVINRTSFEAAIKEEWNRCKRHSIPLSLIMVDIDFFKEFNDNYGHQAGDSCIKLVADVLSFSARRSSDKVARYGGDEFVILLPYTNKENAMNLAEQMRKGVEEKQVPHSFSDVSDYVTISLGVNTVIPSDETSIDDFISNTDRALYKAKEKRNCSV